MTDTVISAEHLSKSYLVGHNAPERERYVALRDVIVRGASNFVRKSADMARGRQIIEGDAVEEFWALKDVSFEVRRGEVLGVIGSNGAGKSTLLKILSRITEPTEGRVRIRGRVSSLLEVGTGFHPELTGRENIYLNGAILGMTRAEIKREFDGIVDFSGVEKFLDTPVKRYSSGMYVRLAFAVAAHLEPEILVVDEVLAVGDAEFQKKCLGRLRSVSRQEGRTVLFVSHNMQAVRQLCQRGLWLKGGHINAMGATEDVVTAYLTSDKRADSLDALNVTIAACEPDPAFRLNKVDIRQDGVSSTNLVTGKPVEIRFDYDVLQDSRGLHVYFLLYDSDGSLIFESLHNGDSPESQPLVRAGTYISTALVPADFLAARQYEVQIRGGIDRVRAFFATPPSVQIDVYASGTVNRAYPSYKTPGKLAPLLPWRTERV